MQQAVKSAKGTLSRYAEPRDFCRAFAEQMDDLYVLSLLLTASPVEAEQCFVSALQTCFKATNVFREWTHSWARRSVIDSAIRMMDPVRHAPAVLAVDPTEAAASLPENGTPLPAILSMRTFERFVFVLSVLEHYSDQDSKTLLGCSRQELIQARTRALKHIGEWRNAPVPQVTPETPVRYAQAS